MCNEERGNWVRLQFIKAALFHAAWQLHLLVRLMVKIDKLAFVEGMARQAQKASRESVAKSTYAIVSSLAGTARMPGVKAPVMRHDGTISQSEEQRQFRWQEHGAAVFGGEIVPVDADGSSGVNKKKLRGETTRTWRAAP